MGVVVALDIECSWSVLVQVRRLDDEGMMRVPQKYHVFRKFSILWSLMLENCLRDRPEICVGVRPHALVCAKKFSATGLALRAFEQQ